MMSPIYALLIRLHPEKFRRRFGAEMMAAFEQAAMDGWGVRLLVDGVLSLARQWLKEIDGSSRADQTFGPAGPGYLEILRRRSIEVASRVWRFNAAWATVLILLYAIGNNWPLALNSTRAVIFVLVSLLLILKTSPGLMQGPTETMLALSLKENPRLAQLKIERQQLENSSYFLLLLASMAGVQHVIQLLGGQVNIDTTARVIRLVIVSSAFLAAIPIQVRLQKMHRAAIEVLQTEIDAIRSAQSKDLA
jgi:hypothetical protein